MSNDISVRTAAGLHIYTAHWLPAQAPKAVLVVAHGLGEHCGRYKPFIDYFVARGCAVYALDHESHGKSEGMRGYIHRFGDFVATLHDYIGKIRARHQGLPVFLVGHSMGGVISVNYLLAHQQGLSGCILSGPALATDDVISPVQKKILKILSLLTPKLPLIKIEGAAVSRDPAVVKAYETDPLVFRGKATARLLTEIVSSADKGLQEAAKITLPLLMLHGGSDLLAHPKGSEKLANSVSSRDKTLKIYPELYHEIFLEPENQQVFADIDAWLTARI